MIAFGLKKGQDLENQTAHPTKDSQEYPPGMKQIFDIELIMCRLATRNVKLKRRT